MDTKKMANKVSASVADEDGMVWKDLIAPMAEKLFDEIEDVFGKLENEISEWNAPGARAALIGAIKAGLDRKGFMSGKAKAVLGKYTKTR